MGFPGYPRRRDPIQEYLEQDYLGERGDLTPPLDTSPSIVDQELQGTVFTDPARSYLLEGPIQKNRVTQFNDDYAPYLEKAKRAWYEAPKVLTDAAATFNEKVTAPKFYGEQNDDENTLPMGDMPNAVSPAFARGMVGGTAQQAAGMMSPNNIVTALLPETGAFNAPSRIGALLRTLTGASNLFQSYEGGKGAKEAFDKGDYLGAGIAGGNALVGALGSLLGFGQAVRPGPEPVPLTPQGTPQRPAPVPPPDVVNQGDPMRSGYMAGPGRTSTTGHYAGDTGAPVGGVRWNDPYGAPRPYARGKYANRPPQPVTPYGPSEDLAATPRAYTEGEILQDQLPGGPFPELPGWKGAGDPMRPGAPGGSNYPGGPWEVGPVPPEPSVGYEAFSDAELMQQFRDAVVNGEQEGYGRADELSAELERRGVSAGGQRQLPERGEPGPLITPPPPGQPPPPTRPPGPLSWGMGRPAGAGAVWQQPRAGGSLAGDLVPQGQPAAPVRQTLGDLNPADAALLRKNGYTDERIADMLEKDYQRRLRDYNVQAARPGGPAAPFDPTAGSKALGQAVRDTRTIPDLPEGFDALNAVINEPDLIQPPEAPPVGQVMPEDADVNQLGVQLARNLQRANALAGRPEPPPPPPQPRLPGMGRFPRPTAGVGDTTPQLPQQGTALDFLLRNQPTQGALTGERPPMFPPEEGGPVGGAPVPRPPRPPRGGAPASWERPPLPLEPEAAPPGPARPGQAGPDPLAQLLGTIGQETAKPIGQVAEDFLTDPHKDSLTGLPNRRAYERAGQQPGIIHGRIDLDNLKGINDVHGHAAGDQAIKIAGDVLHEFSRRTGDQAFRISGDEFGLIIQAPQQGVAGTAALQQEIETRIQQRLAAAGLGEAGGRQTGASVGFGVDDASADQAAIARKQARGVSQPREGVGLPGAPGSTGPVTGAAPGAPTGQAVQRRPPRAPAAPRVDPFSAAVESYWPDVLAAARERGYAGSESQLRERYNDAAKSARELGEDLRAVRDEHSPDAVIEFIKSIGGMRTYSHGLHGEKLRGDLESIVEGFRSKTGRNEFGARSPFRNDKRSNYIDEVIDAMKGSGRFPEIQDERDLLNYLDRASRTMDDAAYEVPEPDSLMRAAGVDPTTNWWEDQGGDTSFGGYDEEPSGPPEALTTNASGESPASLEALSRQEGMKARGEQFGVYDRAGNFRPLIGPDAVDYHTVAGETYGVLDADGHFRILENNGGKIPPDSTVHERLTDLKPLVDDAQRELERHNARLAHEEANTIDLGPGDYSVDQQIADILGTGEAQPRLPGAEEARQVGKADTTFKAPQQATGEDFNLEAAETPEARAAREAKEAPTLEGLLGEEPPEGPAAPTGFTTSQGSRYETSGQGTTRIKASGETFGASDKTIYLDPEIADRTQAHLESFNEKDGPTTARLHVLEDGQVAIVVKDRATGKVRDDLSRIVPGKDAPAVGLHPLEVWKKTAAGERAWHFGNAITEIGGGPPEPPTGPVVPKPPTPPTGGAPAAAPPKPTQTLQLGDHVEWTDRKGRKHSGTVKEFTPSGNAIAYTADGAKGAVFSPKGEPQPLPETDPLAELVGAGETPQPPVKPPTEEAMRRLIQELRGPGGDELLARIKAHPDAPPENKGVGNQLTAFQMAHLLERSKTSRWKGAAGAVAAENLAAEPPAADVWKEGDQALYRGRPATVKKVLDNGILHIDIAYRNGPIDTYVKPEDVTRAPTAEAATAEAPAEAPAAEPPARRPGERRPGDPIEWVSTHGNRLSGTFHEYDPNGDLIVRSDAQKGKPVRVKPWQVQEPGKPTQVDVAQIPPKDTIELDKMYLRQEGASDAELAAFEAKAPADPQAAAAYWERTRKENRTAKALQRYEAPALPEDLTTLSDEAFDALYKKNSARSNPYGEVKTGALTQEQADSLAAKTEANHERLMAEVERRVALERAGRKPGTPEAKTPMLRTTAESLDDISARHPVEDQAKVDELEKSMRRVGWKGRPALVVKLGDVREAWTATHRLAAAQQAGLTPDQVPILEVDGQKLVDAGYDLDDLSKMGKKKRIAAFRQAGLTDAADLLENEQIGSPARTQVEEGAADVEPVPQNVKEFLVRQLRYTPAEVDAMGRAEATRLGNKVRMHPEGVAAGIAEYAKPKPEGYKPAAGPAPNLGEASARVPADELAKLLGIQERRTALQRTRVEPGEGPTEAPQLSQQQLERALSLVEETRLARMEAAKGPAAPMSQSEVALARSSLTEEARKRGKLLANPTPENLDEYARLLGEAADRQARREFKGGTAKEKEMRKETRYGEYLAMGFGGFEKLLKERPDQFWTLMRMTGGAIVGAFSTGEHSYFGDDPLMGAIYGAALGAAANGKILAHLRVQAPTVAKKLAEMMPVKLGGREGVTQGVSPIRTPRDLTKDLGVIEKYATGQPHTVVPDVWKEVYPIMREMAAGEAGQPSATPQMYGFMRKLHVEEASSILQHYAKDARERGLYDRANYLDAMRDEIRGVPTWLEQTVSDLTKYKLSPVTLEPKDVKRISQVIEKVIYTQILGFALNSGIINRTQIALAAPHIGVEGVLEGIKQRLTPEGQAAAAHFNEARPTATDEPVAGGPMKPGLVRKIVRTLDAAASWPMAAGDIANQKETYLGAMYHARKQGLSPEAAHEWAMELTQQVHGVRGELGANPFHRQLGPLRMLTKFPSIFAQLAQDIASHPDPAVRRRGLYLILGGAAFSAITGINLLNYLFPRLGLTAPAWQAGKDVLAHVTQTADHPLSHDINPRRGGKLVVPRYLQQLGHETKDFYRYGFGTHPEFTSQGAPSGEHTAWEGFLKLIGGQTTRQTKEAGQKEDAYDFLADALRRRGVQTTESKQDLRDALESGDKELAAQAVSRMTPAQIRDFYRQNGMGPYEILRRRVPPEDRAKFDERFREQLQQGRR